MAQQPFTGSQAYQQHHQGRRCAGAEDYGDGSHMLYLQRKVHSALSPEPLVVLEYLRREGGMARQTKTGR